MRVRVSHATTYHYDAPADGVIQVLRQTPSYHLGQTILSWRVDVDADGFLRERRDAFGNITHSFFADKPVQALTVRASGVAEIEDRAGAVAGALEPFEPLIYLRTTELTEPDPAIGDLAARFRGVEPLEALHGLMGALHGGMTFDTEASQVATRAGDALARGRGVCQDYAQIFIAAARCLGLPARYVSGHLVRPETEHQEAAHAWAEAHVDGLGWIGFDAANGICPDAAYLRVAVGLDYVDAAPVRGARRGGGEERLSVAVRASVAGAQRQE